MNGNHVNFEGNLVNRTDESDDSSKADVLTLVTAANGTRYARFSLARTFQRNGKDETTYLDCVVFGTQAENFVESVTKGCRVMVEGHLNQSRWETADGMKRSKIELVAETVSVVLRWATAIVEKNPATPPAPEPEPAQPQLTAVPNAIVDDDNAVVVAL